MTSGTFLLLAMAIFVTSSACGGKHTRQTHGAIFDRPKIDGRWREAIVITEPWRGACTTANGQAHAVSNTRLYEVRGSGSPASVPLALSAPIGYIRGARCASQKIIVYGETGGTRGFVAPLDNDGRGVVQELPMNVVDLAIGPQGTILAVGPFGVWIRLDAGWKEMAMPAASPAVSFRAVQFNGQEFAAAGDLNEPNTSVVVFGALGKGALVMSRVPTARVYRLANFRGVWFIGGGEGEIWKQKGDTWSRVSAPLSGDVVALEIIDQRLTAVSGIGAIATSADGESWGWESSSGTDGHEVVGVINHSKMSIVANFYAPYPDFTKLFKN